MQVLCFTVYTFSLKSRLLFDIPRPNIVYILGFFTPNICFSRLVICIEKFKKKLVFFITYADFKSFCFSKPTSENVTFTQNP